MYRLRSSMNYNHRAHRETQRRKKPLCNSVYSVVKNRYVNHKNDRVHIEIK